MDGGGLLPSDHLKGGAAQLPRPVPAPRRPAWARPGTRRTRSRRGSITGSGATLPSGSRVRSHIEKPDFHLEVKWDIFGRSQSLRCGVVSPNFTANIYEPQVLVSRQLGVQLLRQNRTSILESVQVQTVTGH